MVALSLTVLLLLLPPRLPSLSTVVSPRTTSPSRTPSESTLLPVTLLPVLLMLPTLSSATSEVGSSLRLLPSCSSTPRPWVLSSPSSLPPVSSSSSCLPTPASTDPATIPLISAPSLLPPSLLGKLSLLLSPCPASLSPSPPPTSP